MAQSAAADLFPLSVTFTHGPLQKTFRDRSEIEAWRADEQKFWQPYLAGGDIAARTLEQNVQRLNRLSGEDAGLSSRLESFANDYLPSEAGFSRVVERVRANDPNVARLAVWIFLTPQNAQWQNNREFVQSASLVTAYQALGDPNSSREIIEEAVSTATALKEAEAARSGEFKSLYDKIEDEFQIKFDGYEAKMALSAPTHYWSRRATKHATLAATARKTWAWWTGIVTFTFATSAVVIFTGIGEWASNEIDSLLGVTSTVGSLNEPLMLAANLLKRALVLGGLLGIGVWWLRQLLRELRSHEHLAEDAEERVTMIETYAALKAAGIGTDDFTPILAALYRAAATGLVADDGGGPVFPWDMIKAAVRGREG